MYTLDPQLAVAAAVVLVAVFLKCLCLKYKFGETRERQNRAMRFDQTAS